MRIRLFLLGTFAALAAAAAAVGAPTTGPATSGAPPLPRPVGFDVSATFSLLYEVKWRIKKGRPDPSEPCSPWRDDAGEATVFAHNFGAKERPRLKPLQGHLAPSLQSILPPGVPIPPGVKLPRVWAELSLLGAAKGSFNRLWIQNGGPPSTPCGGQAVVPFQRYDDDCGRQAFELPRARPATIRAEARQDVSDLFGLTRRFLPAPKSTPVLSVSVPAPAPFRRCRTTTRAPEVIGFMGLPLTAKDVRALRNLGLNKIHRVEARLSGECDNDWVLDHDNTCRFFVKGWVAIRHIQRNPYTR